MLIVWLGGLLFIAGLVYLVAQTIWHGRMSRAEPSPAAPPGGTLEPPRRGVRFLGLGRNLPGLLMMAAGALLLLAGAVT